jgi:hypothetical protein
MAALLDGPVRSRAFWVFVVAELAAIAGSLNLAPELVGQAESITLHVVNIVFYASVMSGTAGTIPMTKVQAVPGKADIYTEKTYLAGDSGMAVSELLLLVTAVCVLIGLLFGWGLAN